MIALPGRKKVPCPGTFLGTFVCVLWALLASQWNMAHAQGDGRQLAEAQAAIRLAVDRYGPNAIETVPPRLLLAEIHIAEGNFPKAEPLLQQALNISLRVSGTSHKSLLPILERLAWIDIRNNRFNSGKQFYTDAIEIARRVYGANSPIMQRLIDSLALARQKEREAGNQAIVRHKQPPPSQEPPPPAYDLVIANQNQPPPTATTASSPVGDPTKTREGKSSPAVVSGTAPTVSSPPQPVAAEPGVPSPSANSPFLFGVDAQQPAIPKAKPPVASQVQPAATVAQTTPVTPPPGVAVAQTPVVPPPQQPSTGTSPAPQATVASPAPNSAPADRQSWFISVGCFSESANGEEQLQMLRQLGLPAYSKQQRGGALICVYSGPYTDANTAEAARKEIQEKGNVPDAYVRTSN